MYRARVAIAFAALLLTASACAQSGTKPPAPIPSPVAEAAAAGETVPLFNGEDLSGWKAVSEKADSPASATWQVREAGVLHCTGTPTGYLRTEASFKNYRLEFEWRFPGAPGNSGVLLHATEPDLVWPKCIEAQLESENAGDIWVIGGATFDEHKNKDDRRVVKRARHNEKPLGEWNQYRIECVDGAIALSVNGLTQNTATNATVREGFIGLQSEGVPIEFRNIRLTPLK